MMQIAVFGAAGTVGMCVIQHALENGHSVVAAASQLDAAKLRNINDPHFQIKRLEEVNEDNLATVLSGCEAVISCQGFKKDTLDTQAVIVIANAMRCCNIKRLILLAGPNSMGRGRRGMRYLSCCNSMEKNVSRMEFYLEDTCDDLDWTLVKPPKLIESPPIHGSCFAQEGRSLPKIPAKIAVMNLAEFLIEQVSENTWYKKSVFIMPPKHAISI